ncbi:glycosyltransferase [Roseixanthobacter pseudopolyaromaticivorans]|uniref:glycosyltransferase n=1 Tax=Xanthobacteraceae TaxID=335928 RepID=UPI003728356D
MTSLHFAVVAPPLSGHFNPLMALSRTLVARGHRVTFYHMADAADMVRDAPVGFRAVGLSSHPAGALKAHLDTLANPTGPLGLLRVIRETADITDMLCRDLPDAFRAERIDAVIADQTEAAGALVARHLKLPFVSTATALPLNREIGLPPPFVDWPYDPTEKGRWWSEGGWKVTDFLMKPMAKVVARHAEAFGLDPLADQGFSPLLQVAQCVKGLDFPRNELPLCFHYCGPFRTPEVDARLDFDLHGDGRPLVFCSLGTLQGARADLFQAVAKAAQKLNVRLVLAHGGLLSDEAARALPGDPVVRAFVPQRQVLAHCKAAVIHAGFNTVMDALSVGVPLVAMPIAFEQPGISARLLYSGVARIFPAKKASARRVEEALGLVLSDPAYAIAARRIQSEITASGGVGEAADLILSAVARAQG